MSCPAPTAAATDSAQWVSGRTACTIARTYPLKLWQHVAAGRLRTRVTLRGDTRFYVADLLALAEAEPPAATPAG